MEDGIGAKEGYKPLAVEYGPRNVYKETYRPPTS